MPDLLGQVYNKPHDFKQEETTAPLSKRGNFTANFINLWENWREL